jgi:hypothetical protein
VAGRIGLLKEARSIAVGLEEVALLRVRLVYRGPRSRIP